MLVLSTSPGNGVITWGGTVLLTAHFTVPGAGRTFALQVSRDRMTWSTLANLATDANGNASLAYRPSDNRWYRAVFAGSSDLAASTSATVRVVVRQINLLRPTNAGRVGQVAAGTTLRFSSTVRPNRPELPQAHVNLVVYRLDGSRWTRVLSRVEAVDGAGIARFGVTFSARGSYYVRSQAVPTAVNANSGWSPIERFDVR